MNYCATKSVVKRKGKETDETLSFTNNNKMLSHDQHDRNKGKRFPLVSFWELPNYMKDNEYILRYYRANWPLKEALFSLFRWHNETLNVWTHLLGFILFLGLTLANLMKPHVVDLLQQFTRSLSSGGEKNVSGTIKDFLGAALLFDLKHQIYYVFLCQPHWQLLYLAGITAMGLFTIVTLLSPTLSTGKHRAFRAMLFCSMGLFGIVPAVHACIVNWANPRRNITLAYECAMAFSYLIGTMFYVTRIPERWKPGWFDLAGHSHQIFHVLVVAGALAHYAATLKLLEWRDTFGCDMV
ncbi:unnamed protein product [Vicia faba]|uniref:Uncharacterized protein n=1 Tax=Vicia faba TaxID=3906 RepID=A0AAV1AJ66_VICFA|nr:unnamed protein product [Vicia faba]